MIWGRAVTNEIVPPPEMLNTIRSPASALEIASRSEPSPLSFVFTTSMSSAWIANGAANVKQPTINPRRMFRRTRREQVDKRSSVERVIWCIPVIPFVGVPRFIGIIMNSPTTRPAQPEHAAGVVVVPPKQPANSTSSTQADTEALKRGVTEKRSFAERGERQPGLGPPYRLTMRFRPSMKFASRN